MADERLRQLERRAAQGDELAAALLTQARRRVGLAPRNAWAHAWAVVPGLVLRFTAPPLVPSLEVRHDDGGPLAPWSFRPTAWRVVSVDGPDVELGGCLTKGYLGACVLRTGETIDVDAHELRVIGQLRSAKRSTGRLACARTRAELDTWWESAQLIDFGPSPTPDKP